jgi:hypothetical protein
MNVFAVLYDIATREESLAILERITARGRGIDAPAGMYSPTYYFAWYLVRAFEHAGLAERYFELLQSWRDLLAFNYTTWRTREQPRRYHAVRTRRRTSCGYRGYPPAGRYAPFYRIC